MTLGKIIADFETQLTTQIDVGGTTATLQSATDDDGVALPTGRYFLTIDNLNSQKEHFSCTLTGTALTALKSVSRQGVETSGAVRKHRVGASVSLTDFANLKVIVDMLGGVTGLDSTNPIFYDGIADMTGSTNKLATVKYVNDTAVAGGVDATTTTKGIAKISVAPVSATSPITVGDNDPRVPTQSENDALAGTSGTPSSSNKYVTDADTISSSFVSYSKTTISLTASTKTIADSANGFVTAGFASGQSITLTGSKVSTTMGNPTLTIATPAVASLTTHGLTTNDEIVFSTTGALPTGITAGRSYYVIAAGLTANAFEFSTSVGGSAVNTSGSQSGTHTVTKITHPNNGTYTISTVSAGSIVVVENLTNETAGALINLTASNASKVVRFSTTGDISGIPALQYGDGSDGALLYDGYNTTLSVSPSALTYTLTRDIYATNMTVNSGVTINTGGYQIFVSGVLLNSGTIQNNGITGTAGTTTAGGNTQPAGATASLGISVPISGVGGAGAGSVGGSGTTGAAGTAAASVTNSVGTAGATGGVGGGTTGAGGAGGTVTSSVTGLRNVNSIRTYSNLVGAFKLSSGGGGGASGQNNTSAGTAWSGSGGGGGSGGGMVAIFAKTIGGSGTISAIGGIGGVGGDANGASANGSGGGGGGGGGGGIILIVTKTSTNPFTTTVTGGAGGAGGLQVGGQTNGTTGGTGVAGVVYFVTN